MIEYGSIGNVNSLVLFALMRLWAAYIAASSYSTAVLLLYDLVPMVNCLCVYSYMQPREGHR